jgi:hypothetical protein
MSLALFKLASSDFVCSSYNSNNVNIAGKRALWSLLQSSNMFHRSVSTCQNQCGINTWCTGDWVTPSSLTCSCFDGYISSTSDDKACTGLNPAVRICRLCFCWLMLFERRWDIDFYYDDYDDDYYFYYSYSYYYYLICESWLDSCSKEHIMRCGVCRSRIFLSR